ncbi:uncharacterized protein J4E78_003699 [Alternaria triticimaculans]|uniref:uncharacterized protein n=1 Tax=Alternaria triticimaculans TaxID=297637 RepID=UPI0020C56478|nr:uncharacterized protein J4E78_003699 [Alternaria triticimaculans]KAI4663288.1 hypothetical protein J4E78_003699 [Alternaria triticimaculans]
MPPKKKTAAAEGGAFRWTLENEKKLLILTQGRYLTAEDYERIVGVFPGTSIKGVQVRVSLLRVEQRKLYEEYGWTLPEGGAKAKTPVTTPRKTPNNKTASGKKRGAGILEGDGGDGLDEEEELATPSKKPRAKKAKTKSKKEESVEDAVEEEDVSSGGDGKNVGVKEEVLDEELDEMV